MVSIGGLLAFWIQGQGLVQGWQSFVLRMETKTDPRKASTASGVVAALPLFGGLFPCCPNTVFPWGISR